MEIIDWGNKRVLTTAQLAEVFGVEAMLITKNFNRNKDRYADGVHFIAVKGQELKEFKTSYQIDSQLKHSPILYLWTEKGVFLHAKSLNTDQAWNAYSQLVDDYFKKVEQLKEERADMMTTLSPQLQFMILTEQRQNELERKQKELEDENAVLKESFTMLKVVVDSEIVLTKNQKAEIQQAVDRRQGQLNREGYTQAHFQGIYKTLKTHFNVPSYSEIKRCDFEKALNIISGWYPKKAEV